ncbi:MAG: Murein DD-endopeptidase MepM [Syntrophaceae bacterium PtaB.Bin038]|nr:MAG: Murein DD-endopeptidase MepM [Syntrophaceae bacterium PtaB.Bin038]
MNRMYLIALAAVVALAGAAVWAFNTVLEFEKPAVTVKDDLSTIGQGKAIALTVTDRKSGIRSVSVSIAQEGRETELFTRAYPKGTEEEALSVEVNPRARGLKDGPAAITVTAEDHSWLRNRGAVSIETVIDTVPPQIALISTAHNVNTGGTGVAVYRVSEDVTTTGLKMGDRFFRGYPISIQGKPCHIAYFAVPTTAGKGDLKILITAKDRAGNESTALLPHLVREKKFKADKITISRAFIDGMAPAFRRQDPRVPTTPLEAFLFINEKLRDENFMTIREACSKTQPKPLWEGTFLRMRNAAPMAGFGEERTYWFEGMAVSRSTHLGVDLASTEHAPIEAANHGTVVFAGPLGIYGNAVIVDHGLGLCSLYAHLSEIGVKPGQAVTRGETLGASGSTGLASGDHLHFSILVGGEFVNPTEWWDAHWIRDNVTGKLTEPSSQPPPPAAKAQPAKAKPKPKKKGSRVRS